MNRIYSFFPRPARYLPAALCLAWLLFAAGCSKPADPFAEAKNPKDAAAQLDEAFAHSPRQLKKGAGMAASALRNGDYERAVAGLQFVHQSQSLSIEQGMAVHNSMVVLESRLIYAMDAGDTNARRAYELLKAMKRD